MGACFNFYILKASTKSEAVEWFKEHAEQDRYDNGHSYSGGIGMKHSLVDGPQDFQTAKDAEEWVAEHNEKWGPAHLVRLKEGRFAVGGWCSE